MAEQANAEAYEPRLRTEYRERIRGAMREKFGYTNEMQIPKLDKIVVNMGIGDNRHPPLAQTPGALRHQFGEQPSADPNLIGAASYGDGNYSHSAIPFSTVSTVLVCGPSLLITWIGASA